MRMALLTGEKTQKKQKIVNISARVEKGLQFKGSKQFFYLFKWSYF